MKETLKLENINVDTIRTESLADLKGEIFYSGYTTDIDVLIENGNLYLVEVKSTTNRSDVAHFLQNVALYEKQTQKKVSMPILISLRIKENAKFLAENQNIRVIAGEIFD